MDWSELPKLIRKYSRIKPVKKSMGASYKRPRPLNQIEIDQIMMDDTDRMMRPHDDPERFQTSDEVLEDSVKRQKQRIEELEGELSEQQKEIGRLNKVVDMQTELIVNHVPTQYVLQYAVDRLNK